MSKYRLCYKINNIINAIELSKIDFLENKDLTDLKTIDDFTIRLSNKEELLNFLKKNELIPQNIDRLFIAKEKKDKATKKIVYEKIYDGEYLLYQKDEPYRHISYIYQYLITNMKTGRVIREIAERYYKKYFAGEYGPGHIRNSVASLRSLSGYVEHFGYDSLLYSDVEVYRRYIEDFMIYEFYKYEYLPFTEEFIKKRDKDGNSMRNYKNIRSFVINILLKNKKNMEKKQEETKKICTGYIKVQEIDYDHEEFLTDEDFEVVNNQILESYEEYKEGPYIDGHDIIKPLTRRELKKELDGIAKTLVRKGDAYH